MSMYSKCVSMLVPLPEIRLYWYRLVATRNSRLLRLYPKKKCEELLRKKCRVKVGYAKNVLKGGLRCSNGGVMGDIKPLTKNFIQGNQYFAFLKVTITDGLSVSFGCKRYEYRLHKKFMKSLSSPKISIWASICG